MSGSPRFLIVGAWPPWGTGSGYYHRFRVTIEALRSLGTVDLCLAAEVQAAEHHDVPDWFGEVTWLRVEQTDRWAPKAVLGLAAPVRQARIAPEHRAAAEAWFRRPYDLTWCIEQRTFAPLAHLLPGPVVLDLYDVMSSNVAHKRGVVLRHPLWSRTLRQVVHQPEYLPSLPRRWRRWEADAADAVDRVVVCSELDQQRLGRPAAVVPNSYPVPSHPAGDGPRPAGLAVAMVGMWGYQPNFDAARWFVRRILPEVQAVVPDATFHMIGPTAPAVIAELGGRSDVVLHGLVDDPGEQLRHASVVVAPTRFGGGTRVKILEAFAHRLPVVATSMGAEGLEVRDGEHLLVRDDARSFARAVLDLHADDGLRARLVASAAARHAERYTPCHSAAVIRREVAALTGVRSGRERAEPA